MELKLNIVDRAIGFFSPEKGARRAQYRAMQSVMGEQLRAYDAAGKGRRTKGWIAGSGSANRETANSLTTLRNRSREMVRNNAYAKRAIQAIATNTIGLGIRATPVKTDGKDVTRLKKAWTDWAESTNCDYDGQANFYGIQRMVMRCVAESGECLVRRRWVTGMDTPIQLQVLEPDFLDHSHDRPVTTKGGYAMQGVEFGPDGKRVGYWLYPCHPGEGLAFASELVPASEVLHVYYKERAGQVRGVPFGSSSALSLYDFDEYEQAQLVRQKIAACFAIFVQDNDADTTRPGNGTSKPFNRERVEPGIIEHLPQGKTITFATPPGVQNYDEYGSSMLRKIAVGFGVSYEVLSGDLSNVNFSSGRMGWIEFHRLISEWQSLMLIPMMCDPIWAWFIEGSAIMGVAKVGQKATWTPPRREMIDPVKELKGMSEAIRNGLESWSNSIKMLGGDPEEVLAQIVADCKAFDDGELMLACDPRYDPTRSNGALPVEADPNDPTEELTGKQTKQQKAAAKKK